MPRPHSEQVKQASRIPATHDAECRATPDLESTGSHRLDSTPQESHDALIRQHHLDSSPVEQKNPIAAEEQCGRQEGYGALNDSKGAEKKPSSVCKAPELTQDTAQMPLRDLFNKAYKNVLTDLEKLLQERIETISNTLALLTSRTGDGRSSRRSARTSSQSKKLSSSSTQTEMRSAALQARLYEIWKLKKHIPKDTFHTKLIPQVLGYKKGIGAQLLAVAQQACRPQHAPGEAAGVTQHDDTELSYHLTQMLRLCALPLCYHDCLAIVRDPIWCSELLVSEAKDNTRALLGFMKQVYEQAVDCEYSPSADPEGAGYLLSLLLSIHGDPGAVQKLLEWFVIPIVAVETPPLIRLRTKTLTDREIKKVKDSIRAGEEATHKEARHHAYKLGYRQLTFSLLACSWSCFESQILAPLLVEHQFSNDLTAAVEGLLKAGDRTGNGKVKPDWHANILDFQKYGIQGICSQFITPNGFQSLLEKSFEPSGSNHRQRPDASAYEQASGCAARIADPVYWLSRLRLYITALALGYSVFEWGQESGLQADNIDSILDNFDQLIRRQVLVSFMLTYSSTKTLVTAFHKLSALPASSESCLIAFCGISFRKARDNFNTLATPVGEESWAHGVSAAIVKSYDEVVGRSQDFRQLIQSAPQQEGRLWSFNPRSQNRQYISTHSWTQLDHFAENIIFYLLPKLSGPAHFVEKTSFDLQTQPSFVLFEAQLRELIHTATTDSATPLMKQHALLFKDEQASFEKMRIEIKELSYKCNRQICAIKQSLDGMHKAKPPSRQNTASWLEDKLKLHKQYMGIMGTLYNSDYAKLLVYCINEIDCPHPGFPPLRGYEALECIQEYYGIIRTWIAETDLQTQFTQYKRYFDEHIGLFHWHVWYSLHAYALTIADFNGIELKEFEEQTKKLEIFGPQMEDARFQHARCELARQHAKIRDDCQTTLTTVVRRLSELSTQRDTLSKGFTGLEKNLTVAVMPQTENPETQGSLQKTDTETDRILRDLGQTQACLSEHHASISTQLKELYLDLKSQIESQSRELFQATKRFMSEYQLLAKEEESDPVILDCLLQRIGNGIQPPSGKYPDNNPTNHSTFFSKDEWEQLSSQFEFSKANIYQQQFGLRAQASKLRQLTYKLRTLQVSYQNELEQTQLKTNIHERIYNLESMASAHHFCAIKNLDTFIQTLTPKTLSIATPAHTPDTTKIDLSSWNDHGHELCGLLQQYKRRFPVDAQTSGQNSIDSAYEALQSELKKYHAEIDTRVGQLSTLLATHIKSLDTQISEIIQEIFQKKLPQQTEALDCSKKSPVMLETITVLYGQYEQLCACMDWCARTGISLCHDKDALNQLGRSIINCQRYLQCEKNQRNLAASARIRPKSTAQTTQPHSPEDVAPAFRCSEQAQTTPVMPPAASGDTKSLENDLTTRVEQLKRHIAEEEELLGEQACLQALFQADRDKNAAYRDQVKEKITQYCAALEENKASIAKQMDPFFKLLLTALKLYAPEQSEAFHKLLGEIDTPNESPEIEYGCDLDGNIHEIRIHRNHETDCVKLSKTALKNLPQPIHQALNFLLDRYISEMQGISSSIVERFKQQLQTLGSDETSSKQTSCSPGPDFSLSEQQRHSPPSDAIPKETSIRKYSETYNHMLKELAKTAHEALQSLTSKQEQPLKTQKSPDEIAVEIKKLFKTCEQTVQTLQTSIARFDWEFQYVDPEIRRMHLDRMKIQSTLDQLNGILCVLESQVLARSNDLYRCASNYISCISVSVLPCPVQTTFPIFWSNPEAAATSNIPLQSTQAYLMPGPY